MGDGFEVDPDALRAAAADLDGHAAQVASHGETLDANTASPVGHGAIGEAIDAATKRALRIVAHDLSTAVHKFYTDAATVMRKTAAETERQDAEARQAFDELGGGRPDNRTTQDAWRNVTDEPERGMAGGFRRSHLRKLSADDIDRLRNEFESIGGDPGMLRFNKGPRTAYRDEVDLIYVRGDVLPSADRTVIDANARLSSKAALAHELGHRQFRGTALEPGDVRDEIRASVWAAKNVPGLSDEERIDLLLDAQQRARGAGELACVRELDACLRQPIIKWRGWPVDLPWWKA